MVLTPSNMLPLGTKAPDFTLLNPRTEQQQSLQSLRGKQATVILFICNHCPYVIHIQDKIAEVAQQYQSKGVNFIAINANDIEQYPDDSPDKMIAMAKACGFSFPYLFDETQQVAKAYDAACTPDCYIFNHELCLTYRGQFDAARPGNDVPVTGANLSQALDIILTGQTPDEVSQTPSVGCNIKWKPVQSSE